VAPVPGWGSAQTRAVFNRPTHSSPIVLSRNDRLLFSVNPADDTLAVLHAGRNVLLSTIPVGREPRSVAVDPNNTFAYVANAASSDVSVVQITDASPGRFAAFVLKTIKTGAEPWNVVISPNGKRVFVANSGQDTVSVINAKTNALIGHVDLRNSPCNAMDRNRHFQPRGLAVDQGNTQLYVTRFLSFTRKNGQQGADDGKDGSVCRINIDTNANTIGGYQPADKISLAPRKTGFKIDSNGDGVPDDTTAFSNQLQSIVIRGGRAYLPNIAASPQGPLRFDTSTQAFVNTITGVGTDSQKDGGAINLHLGAREPEPGKKRLFFANPWAIAFTNQSGAGNAYVVSAGSDLLVKLNVGADGKLNFTGGDTTTRYIDLNDPANPKTRGANAGKNPNGIAINSDGTKAYVTNFVSRNVSIVNLATDSVQKVVQTAPLPAVGTVAERVTVGAEVFFSSRGHFDRPAGTTVSTSERLSADGWQNCASCHFNGLSDGVVWQFGSGPRKSVNLAGTFNPNNRNQQKVLNYSAIFDEIEDFELNIRNVSGPGNTETPQACANPPSNGFFDRNHGLLIGDDGDVNRAPCVINALAKSNAAREQVTVTLPGSATAVPALTALKEFVKRGIRVPNGPLNSDELPGGVPVDQIQQGRSLFAQSQCSNCHSGGLWSSSAKRFTSPPAVGKAVCETFNSSVPACTDPAMSGNPVNLQFLFQFLRNIGSFNLGVPGQGNDIGSNIGAAEKAAAEFDPELDKSLPAKDGLGADYNGDGKGAGFSPQSLLGVFATPPYYHNGACETLACVVGNVKHRTANGTLPDVLDSDAKRRAVVRFLESIDQQTAPFP
jgi:YVTN family beta-propeller protein